MKKLDAYPWIIQSFEHHLNLINEFKGDCERSTLWEKITFGLIRLYFQVKDFWFYENLTGNIRDLTRFGKPDIFGNKPVQRKKNRQIARYYRIHQLHLIAGKGFLVL